MKNRILTGSLFLGLCVCAAGGEDSVSLSELQRRVAERGHDILSFRTAGVVCAVVHERNQVVLQDDSGTVFLALPAIDPALQPGQWLEIKANHCALTRAPFGVELGTAPTVETDGRHAALLKSGTVYLEPGQQPIRLAWFNGEGPSALNVEYEGPGVPRQRIPPNVLWRKSRPNDTRIELSDENNKSQLGMQPGLDYQAYLGTGWYFLPDFTRLRPATEGTALSFDLAYSAREFHAALVFTGYLEVATAGLYTFHLESDDGGRLYVGDPASHCQAIALDRRSTPTLARLEHSLTGSASGKWVEFEGLVTFAGTDANSLEVELPSRPGTVHVCMPGSALSSAELLHRRIHAVGVANLSPQYEQGARPGVLIVSADQLQIQDPGSMTKDSAVLTTAEEVINMRPARARLHLPARITGVVTWASPAAVVVQDSTKGVYTHYCVADWTAQPRVGELWEIEGTTDRGDFSPVIRATHGRFIANAALPQPIQPTWDQLMNGSLDAQYVEIIGLVTGCSEKLLTLLTPDGRLKVIGNDARPLPGVPGPVREGESKFDLARLETSKRSSLVGCVIRIRGCLTAEWDIGTLQLKAGEISLGAAVVSVETPSPNDPFAVPRRRAPDLLRFDARASALQRTKVAGQVIHARPPEFYLLDGSTGLRLLAREAPLLRAGDLVEAVGFPRLGGSVPVLEEARIRKTGAAPMPKAVELSAEELRNRKYDSTLVQIEGTLINDSPHGQERVLELQTGKVRLIARLNTQNPNWTGLPSGTRLRLTGVPSNRQRFPALDSLDTFEFLVNDPQSLTILARAPWWTVQRAVALACALAGGLGIALVWITLLKRKVEQRTAELKVQIHERQAVEQRRLMEEERTRVAQDLHDELGAGLTEVSILGSLARNPAIAPEAKDHYLDQLTEAARSLITELDEIVWAVNPHYDSVASLATYYSLFAQRFLNLAGIACRLHVSDPIPDSPLDPKFRHGIFLAFKEALNNIVRHSRATEVELKIEADNRLLLIAVSDNGRGLGAGLDDPGKDGLNNMRQRIQKLGGDCRVFNGAGRGVTVEFRLRLQATPTSALPPARGPAKAEEPVTNA